MAYPLLSFVWCSPPLAEDSSRRGERAGAWLAWLACAVAASGCYTSPINRAPTVTIELQAGQIFRGQPASFTAVASDPDADPLTVGWAVSPEDCADPRDSSKWPKVEVEGPLELQRMFALEEAPNTPFCVWAFVTDRHGAVGPSNTGLITPRIRPPIPVITQARPGEAASYKLYTDFVFDADVRFFPANPIAFTWMLTAPLGFTGELESCDPLMPLSEQRCLHADVPGRYIVALLAADGKESSPSPATITVDVLPDQPPCIEVTDPPYASFWDREAGQPAAFQVTRVSDDGDPQDLHYAWFYARPDQPWTFADIDFPRFDFDADEFRLGEQVDVRVEIRDRPNKAAIETALLGCGDDRVCSAQGIPGCFQRVTWTVRWKL